MAAAVMLIEINGQNVVTEYKTERSANGSIVIAVTASLGTQSHTYRTTVGPSDNAGQVRLGGLQRALDEARLRAARTVESRKRAVELIGELDTQAARDDRDAMLQEKQARLDAQREANANLG